MYSTCSLKEQNFEFPHVLVSIYSIRKRDLHKRDKFFLALAETSPMIICAFVIETFAKRCFSKSLLATPRRTDRAYLSVRSPHYLHHAGCSAGGIGGSHYRT